MNDPLLWQLILQLFLILVSGLLFRGNGRCV